MSIVRVMLGVLLMAASVRADPWLDARAQQRTQRQELERLAENDRVERAAAAVATIGALLDRVEAGEVKAHKDDLWQLLGGLARLSPESLGGLPRRVRAIGTDVPANDPQWTKLLAETRAKLTARPWELLQRAADVGSVELAADFMWEVLYFDPDFAPIRRALGQVRVDPAALDAALPPSPNVNMPAHDLIPEMASYDPDRYWMTPFRAGQLKQGLLWSDVFGWVIASKRERYEQNYIYDFDRSKWVDLAEANEYHARPGRDWVLRTEHLEIHGSADLPVLADAATKLEALYKVIFGRFALFFTQSRRVDALRLAVGLAEHRPLVVWIYRDHEEYVRRADVASWTGGVFNPRTGATYFYGRAGETMYHEFTHQVLHVMTGRNESPAWLTEGIATYTMFLGFEMGRVTMYGVPFNGSYSLDDLMAIRSIPAWYRAVEEAGRKGGDSPYGSAGSLVTFCMNGENESLRADFLDYLRDSYQAAARNRELWDYLGLSKEEFAARYAAWGSEGR